jgi:hypothetical protein
VKPKACRFALRLARCSGDLRWGRAGLLVALLTLPVAQSCTDRERANPLDPQNPLTHGKPSRPRVVTGSRVAVVAWEPLALGSLSGYRVERMDDTGAFVPVGPGNLPPWQLSLRDSPLDTGARYYYRLVVLADSREVPSDSTECREGSGSAWFLGENRLLLVSSRISSGVDTVTTVWWSTAIDASTDGTAWAADYGSGALLYLDADPSVAASLPFQGYPADISTEDGSNRCWVVDAWSAQLMRVSPAGTLAWATLPDYPYTVSHTVYDGSVWVGHASGVSRYDSYASLLSTYCEPARPYRVSASPADGSCWALNGLDGTVVRLSTDGGPPLVLDYFDEPDDLSAETPDGCCWVADRGTDRLYLVDSAGVVLGSWEVPGIAAVSACPTTQAAWIVCADGLVRMGRDGQRECAVPSLSRGLPAATVP